MVYLDLWPSVMTINKKSGKKGHFWKPKQWFESSESWQKQMRNDFTRCNVKTTIFCFIKNQLIFERKISNVVALLKSDMKTINFLKLRTSFVKAKQFLSNRNNVSGQMNQLRLFYRIISCGTWGPQVSLIEVIYHISSRNGRNKKWYLWIWQMIVGLLFPPIICLPINQFLGSIIEKVFIAPLS